MEMKSAINSFQTKDMTELLKFHQYVELHLEDLTDETQVTLIMNSFNFYFILFGRIESSLLSNSHIWRFSGIIKV